MKKMTCPLLLMCIFLITKKTKSQNVSYSDLNSRNILGNFNTAFGRLSLGSNLLTGNENTALGWLVLNSNTSGKYNTGVGTNSLLSNTTGENNTTIGAYSLYTNNTGGSNTAIGYSALRINQSGNSNTAIGQSALFQNLTSENTAIGCSTLYNNTTGRYNTAMGKEALFSNQTEDENTAIGYQALFNNEGRLNTAVGSKSLFTNSSGLFNTAVGAASLQDNNGSNNVAIGDGALGHVINANNSVGVGAYTGLYSGTGNVFIGFEAGYNEKGDRKLYISDSLDKTLIYGDFSTGQVLIGNANPVGYQFKGKRKLNVIGGILTDSIRIKAPFTSWADYVFEDNYRLMPVNELENYIKNEKHLPNIPSTKDVLENGIDMATMNAKLLEKIEELHLYIIQLQKKVDFLMEKK